MSANNTGPNHYKDKAVQPWDFIVSNNLGYLEGNVVKYISRWRQKGGVDDLRKAKHYIEKLIETALDEPNPQGRDSRWESISKNYPSLEQSLGLPTKGAK